MCAALDFIITITKSIRGRLHLLRAAVNNALEVIGRQRERLPTRDGQETMDDTEGHRYAQQKRST